MLNAGDGGLIGKLWMSLYWLALDTNDELFAVYCAENAAAKFIQALENNRVSGALGKASVALSLASLPVRLERAAEAVKYCDIAIDCTDSRIKQQASNLRDIAQRSAVEQRYNNED